MATPSNKTILIVEDDPSIREGLSELLTYEGYSVQEASNGQEALDRLSEQSPAAILLDLMMPVMDGFAFLEALRRLRPEIAETVPVLMLTAAGERANAAQGVRAILRKPIEIDDLLGALDRL